MNLHVICRWTGAPMLALALLTGALSAPAAAASDGAAMRTLDDEVFGTGPQHESGTAPDGTSPASANNSARDSTQAKQQANAAAYAAAVPLSPVPEPHIAYMLATGIAVLVLRGRRPSDDDKFDSHDHQNDD